MMQPGEVPSRQLLGRRDFLAAAGGSVLAASLGSSCGDADDAGTPSTTSPSSPATIEAAGDAIFIVEFEQSGGRPRLAVKDLIDVAGVVTTAGSLAVAESATPAEADAACLAGARAADVQIVGKANLTELAYDPVGLVNAYGTPTNPLDPALVPGGSSHGSAVAVATDAADIAYGTDTAGSIRIPAACCGVAGLKTTYGRIPMDGVYPLTPSVDVVGPIARDVMGLVEGMQLLDPDFEEAADVEPVIGRVRSLLANTPISVDPGIEAAVDSALAAAGLETVDVDLQVSPEFVQAWPVLVFGEGTKTNEGLLSRQDLLQPATVQAIERGLSYTDQQLADAREAVAAWEDTVDQALRQVDLLALPTLPVHPPRLDAVAGDPNAVAVLTSLTAAWNAAGVPALAQPIPSDPLPTSLQLVGAKNAEDLLLAVASTIEVALGG